MKISNIRPLWNVVKPSPRPGRGNPLPVRPDPEREPMEPEPTRGPKRKKKSIYEIECSVCCDY